MIIVPVGSGTITLCHWDLTGGVWAALTVPHQALNGHSQHEMDIWPPVEDVTPGMNWPEGEAVYLNGCVLAGTPSPSASESSTAVPSPSPSVSGTLPPTGPVEILGQVTIAVALILTGAWLKMAKPGPSVPPKPPGPRRPTPTGPGRPGPTKPRPR